MPTSDNDKKQGIRILEPEVDLGKFKSTAAIVTKVTVENNSPNEFVLKNLTLSCGCLDSSFEPQTLAAGSDYTFDVTVFNALLGEGHQFGVVETHPPLSEPLEFHLIYEVEPSTYLFPDKLLLGTLSLDSEVWPKVVEFEVLGLDAPLDLIQPIRIEPSPRVPETLLDYHVIQTSRLERDAILKVEVTPRDARGGHINDHFVLALETDAQTLRFPVGMSGILNADESLNVADSAP